MLPKLSILLKMLTLSIGRWSRPSRYPHRNSQACSSLSFFLDGDFKSTSSKACPKYFPKSKQSAYSQAFHPRVNFFRMSTPSKRKFFPTRHMSERGWAKMSAISIKLLRSPSMFLQSFRREGTVWITSPIALRPYLMLSKVSCSKSSTALYRSSSIDPASPMH